MSTATTTKILSIVCEVYDLPLAALRGQGRTKGLARPRMVAMVLLRRYAGLTLNEVAGALARLDHTTVKSALAQAETLLATPDAMTAEARVKAALRIVPARAAAWPGHGAALSRVRRGL